MNFRNSIEYIFYHDTDIKEVWAMNKDELPMGFEDLTEREKKLMELYRENPEFRESVHRVIDMMAEPVLDINEGDPWEALKNKCIK